MSYSRIIVWESSMRGIHVKAYADGLVTIDREELTSLLPHVARQLAETLVTAAAIAELELEQRDT